jgi:hypothetical protein
MKNGDFMIFMGLNGNIMVICHCDDLPFLSLFKHQKDVENSWFSEENDLQMVSFPHHSTST